jgi:hypothetical protein
MNQVEQDYENHARELWREGDQAQRPVEITIAEVQPVAVPPGSEYEQAWNGEHGVARS